MSIFNELLPKICEISNEFTKNFNDELKAAFLCFEKFEEEFQNGKNRAREAQKNKSVLTTLQSINEDEDETVKSNNRTHSSDRASTESTERRGSKKRSKHEVDGIESPEVEKRQKRNASVKAQSIISKQVNVNLTQKMRREDSMEKSGKGRRKKKEDKENTEPPVPTVQIKLEKISMPAEQISIPAEPMDVESLPMKTEPVDNITMPPPAAPVPKPRKVQKEKEKEPETTEEEGSRRRTTRTRKQTDTLPAPSASNRSTRASSRATKQNEEEPPQPETTRPKRTRAKKVVDTSTTDSEKDTQAPAESVTASPAEKPRPKRTRRGQKAAEKEAEKEVEIPQEELQEQTQKQSESTKVSIPISLKKERITEIEPEVVIQSPVLQKLTKINDKNNDKTKINDKVMTHVNDKEVSSDIQSVDVVLDKTKEISMENINMDTTVVLPSGVYNHVPVTPKSVCQMNETVVLDKCNETVVLDKPQTNVIMDATVVIEKDIEPKVPNLTDDNSLLTDDSDSIEQTPPKQTPPLLEPKSAVKEKVQQFEEMASRVTRTKTRAMANKEDPAETQTPPDKISKAILSSETLAKMNNMIFNGKTPQMSHSETKPRANTTKSIIPTSTSKLSAVRAKEDERREKEDARRKKEALLEAKREMQKKKREDKVAAAAAARSAAERSRRALLQAAARERHERQLHADLGKLERLKEAERRKQELARKAADTEERRRAEEAARRQRLADEQRRAGERQRQLEEAEAVKKEAALMTREIEKRQREFLEKQKMKQRMEGDRITTPLKTINGYPPMEPVYMADGFQYLNSDEDEEPVERVPPTWSTSKARRQQLYIQARIQAHHVDKLFSVRAHTPDLQEIFPNIEKNRLKRTSSAVWRTPPRLPVLKE